MKRGKVYIKDVFCGIITESEEGYTFKYDKAYLNMDGATALSPTMPLTDELAMPLFTGGKTTGFNREAFLRTFVQSGVPANVAEKCLAKMTGHKDRWFEIIDNSFLPDDLKDRYKELIRTRLSLL